MRSLLFPAHEALGVAGDLAPADAEYCDEAEEHAEIDAGLVHGRPESLMYQDRHFGGRDRDRDIDSSGKAAKRVANPTRSNTPHAISTTPTNGAVTWGYGMPIFSKRP